MPLTGEAKRLYNQRYYQSHKQTKLTAQTAILPSGNTHTPDQTVSVRPQHRTKTVSRKPSKAPLRPHINAPRSATALPSKPSLVPVSKNAPERQGISLFDLLSAVAGGPSEPVIRRDLRPVPARTHVQPTSEPDSIKPANVPSIASSGSTRKPASAPAPTPAKQTRHFRLPENMQGGTKQKRSRAGAILIRAMFGR